MKSLTHYHQHLTASALASSLVLISFEHGAASASPAGMGSSIAVVGSAVAQSADARRAIDVVQTHIDKHWIKTTVGWTTKFQRKNAVGDVLPGEPNLLYRQLRVLDFTIEPRTLSQEDKKAGVQYSADVTFTKTTERTYRRAASEEGPRGWSAWQDAALGAFATVEKRHGRWMITGTDLFEGVKPNASKIPPG